MTREEHPGRSAAAAGVGSQVPLLALRHLSKSFGGAQALDDVHLTVLPGEIHGLLGENGSGKSTLIRILAGFHAPDAGELEINGGPIKLPLYPGQFLELGISFVHQDLGLIPSLSVVENLRISDVASTRRQWHISWARERKKAAELFSRYGLDIDPGAKVSALLPVERAMLAIVRAVEGFRTSLRKGRASGGLLVLDEPTVFLPRVGIERLFSLIREVAASGAGVLFVSHDLDEAREITDRVTVLRDGHLVGTVVSAEASTEQLVEMIIGRRLEELAVMHHDVTRAKAAFTIDGLSGGSGADVSFELHEGEVLGLTGLVGSGFEEIPYLLFGAQASTGGRLLIGPESYDLTEMTPSGALDRGMALLPADRLRDGSIDSLSIADNVMLQVIDEYFTYGRLERSHMLSDARELCAQFDVRPNQPKMLLQSLSGGNQQKALLAKWLQTKPALLLLHEPTQGVDVGARQQIYGMIRQAAGEGRSIVCATSDYEQLASICDRVLVFARGRVVQQLVGGEVAKDRITQVVYTSAAPAEGGIAAGS